MAAQTPPNRGWQASCHEGRRQEGGAGGVRRHGCQDQGSHGDVRDYRKDDRQGQTLGGGMRRPTRRGRKAVHLQLGSGASADAAAAGERSGGERLQGRQEGMCISERTQRTYSSLSAAGDQATGCTLMRDVLWRERDQGRRRCTCARLLVIVSSAPLDEAGYVVPGNVKGDSRWVAPRMFGWVHGRRGWWRMTGLEVAVRQGGWGRRQARTGGRQLHTKKRRALDGEVVSTMAR